MDHEVRMQRREFFWHSKYQETIPGTLSSRSIFDVQQSGVFFDRVLWYYRDYRVQKHCL